MAKLLSHLSRCSKRSIMEKTDSSIRPYPAFIAHLSTNRESNRSFKGDRRGRSVGESNRSFKGDRRGRSVEDEAEFLQSVDFGDGVNGERSNPSDRNQPPHPPFRPPNRQWRGDRSGPSSNEFPPPFENSNRQFGRETRSRGVNPDDFFPDSKKDSKFQSRNPPINDQPRDLSDSESDEEELPSPVEKSNPTIDKEQGIQNWRAKALGGTGEKLFEKLKLGDKKPDTQQTSGAPQTPPATNEAGSTEPESSPPPPPQDADEIFRKMKETGLIPNAVSMLDGLCKDGLVKEAMLLFSVIREKGIIPEVVIYTAVVEAFCKVSRFNDAIKVFRKMQKNGIVPNAYSYGVIVNGLCKGGRLSECEEFCVEMFEANHSPNPATFVGLVDAFCKAKGVEEGERIVKRFQERNFVIDEKSIREHLDKKGPFEGPVWQAIFGKKAGRRHF